MDVAKLWGNPSPLLLVRTTTQFPTPASSQSISVIRPSSLPLPLFPLGTSLLLDRRGQTQGNGEPLATVEAQATFSALETVQGALSLPLGKKVHGETSQPQIEH